MGRKGQVGVDLMAPPDDPTEPVTALDVVVRGQTSVLVEVKRYWSGEWEPAPHLEALTAEQSAGPSLSRAEFRLRCGPAVKWEDETTFSPQAPYALLNWYVRIRGVWDPEAQPLLEYPAHPTDPWTIWVGLFTRESFDVHGRATVDSDDDDTEVPLADQTITAFGLDVLLDRMTLTKARAFQMVRREDVPAGFYTLDDPEDQVIWVDRVPVFNRRSRWGASTAGNRSYYPRDYWAGAQAGEEFVFAGSVDYGAPYSETQDAQEWSNFDILETVLAQNQPSPVTPPPWQYGPNFVLGGQADALANIVESHRLDGMTVRQIVNKLIDRRRGLGWALRVNDDDDDGAAEIHVFSLTEEPIVIGEDVILAANPETLTIRAERYIDQSLQVRHVEDQRYERIIAYGELIRTMFTLRLDQDAIRDQYGTLVRAWSDTAETDYKDALSSTIAAVNDEYRKKDALSRVFNSFTVMDGWQGQCGIAMIQNCLPIPTDTAGIIAPQWGNYDEEEVAHAWLFTDGKSFLRHLPSSEAAGDLSTRSLAERSPWLVFVYDNVQGRWIEWPHGARPLDGELGIRLDVARSRHHVLARDHWPDVGDAEPAASGFTPGTTTDIAVQNPDFTVNRVAGSWDYTTTVATVALETDKRLRYVIDLYPPGLQPDHPPDIGRVLRLHVRDAHYWWRAASTATGIDSDGNLTTSGATALRDDSDRLETAARIAAQWYRQDRASVTHSRRVVYDAPAVGTMVTEAFDTQDLMRIGTVVTRASWDFQDPRTTIETGYSELDVPAVEATHAA